MSKVWASGLHQMLVHTVKWTNLTISCSWLDRFLCTHRHFLWCQLTYCFSTTRLSTTITKWFVKWARELSKITNRLAGNKFVNKQQFSFLLELTSLLPVSFKPSRKTLDSCIRMSSLSESMLCLSALRSKLKWIVTQSALNGTNSTNYGKIFMVKRSTQVCKIMKQQLKIRWILTEKFIT